MKENVIYTNNYVDEELIKEIEENLKHNDKVEISFSVIGRTRHQMLSEELEEKMPNYKFTIGYNYQCEIEKK